MSLKLIMTLLVRDEEDIIEANIDYHLSQGIDYLIVTDNLSQDRTPAILQRYQRQGRLHLIHESDDTYAQHQWVTRMARMAASDYHADWIINNDADEFWYPTTQAQTQAQAQTQTHPTLKSHFASIPPHIQALEIARANFPDLKQPTPPQTAPLTPLTPLPFYEPPFYERLIYRDTASVNALGRPLPTKICHRAYPDISVAQGNHAATRNNAPLTCQFDTEILIFHYPARSYAQYANKIQLGGAAYQRNQQLPKKIGSTWRHLHQELQAGRLYEHYQAECINPQDIAHNGRYIQDTRLRDTLRSQQQAKPTCPSPTPTDASSSISPKQAAPA